MRFMSTGLGKICLRYLHSPEIVTRCEHALHVHGSERFLAVAGEYRCRRLFDHIQSAPLPTLALRLADVHANLLRDWLRAYDGIIPFQSDLCP